MIATSHVQGKVEPMTSANQAALGAGSDITGEVLYSVHYRGGPLGLLGLLRVHVERVRGLPTSPKVKYPYIEVCLSPKKKRVVGKQANSSHVFNHVEKVHTLHSVHGAPPTMNSRAS